MNSNNTDMNQYPRHSGFTGIAGYSRVKWLACCISILGALTACSLDGLVKVDDPEGGVEIERKTMRSYTGGIRLHLASISSFSSAFNGISRDVGILTDELQALTANQISVGIPYGNFALDSRTESQLPDGSMGITGPSFGILNTARVQASQSIELLEKYGAETSKTMRSHAYAIEGMSIVMLAELFCSGLPLTTVPFEGNVQYSERLTTAQLLEAAIHKFDSSMAIDHDSLPVLTLARVGKGRALLSLGKYKEAAMAVQDVATADQYSFTYTTTAAPGGSANQFAFWTVNATATSPYTIVNREGGRGIQWMADSAVNQDTKRLNIGTRTVNGVLEFALIPRQLKYTNGSPTVPVVNGIQARMIEAEAQLNDAQLPLPGWLDILNEARRTIGLADTTDPGSHTERVDLIMRERAFWFYLTGTRLGDYRRLVRNYGRSPHEVYPSGVYGPARDYPFYGSAYVFVPSMKEVLLNHKYEGCFNRNP